MSATESVTELDAVTLVSPEGGLSARFVPAAGMVCESLRHRGGELLDRRGGVVNYRERGDTMGIPLLYPWANRLARHGYRALDRSVELEPGSPLLASDEQGLPIHGVIPRHLDWHVLSSSEHSVTAELSWRDEALLEVFPFPHRVRYSATLTEAALEIAIRVSAEAGAVPVSFGFHPYLAAGDDEARIELPAGERLILDDRMIPTGQRERFGAHAELLGTRAWDDGFQLERTPSRFTLQAGPHSADVELRDGYRYAQVYAPSSSRFVCFEPMTAPANALASGEGLPVVPERGSFDATFRLAVGGGSSSV